MKQVHYPFFRRYIVTLLLLLVILPKVCSASLCDDVLTLRKKFAKEHEYILSKENTPDHLSATTRKFRQILKGLNYFKVIILSDSFLHLDKQRLQTKPFPSFIPPSPTHSPKNIPIWKIHFMQNSIWVLFHNNKYDMITTAKLLKNHCLKISSLPKIHVWKDKNGHIWTLNHRRVAAAILAGNIKQLPVIWASRKEVKQNQSEYTTRHHGSVVIAYLTTKVGMIIKNSNYSFS